MRPSAALAANRHATRQVVIRFNTANLRVFGSVLPHADREGSDLDLIDPLRSATLLEPGGLEAELEEMLGVQICLLTPGDLPLKFRAEVLSQTQPV